MKTITLSEAAQHFSSIISAVNKEPITLLKQNKSVAVILSSTRYEELAILEDVLYAKAAELAISEGFATDKEAQDLLDSL